MASRSASIFSASFVMAGLRVPRRLAASRRLGAGSLALGLLDQGGDALAILAGGAESEVALPCLDRASVVLLHLVENLPLVEKGGAIFRVEGERLVEGFESRVGMTAHGHDQGEVSHRVHVLGIPLEHGLVGGDGFLIASVEETLPSGLEH